MAIFKFANCKRLPEGKPPFSYGFPMVLAHSQRIFPDPPEFGTRSWLASLCDSLDGGAINRSTELGYDIHRLPWFVDGP